MCYWSVALVRTKYTLSNDVNNFPSPFVTKTHLIEEFTLKISRVKSHDFFSCDEKSHNFSCEKCVSCDFTQENFLRVMKNYV